MIRNRHGQVLLETICLAVFFAVFFGVLITFAGNTHQRLEKSRWSTRAK